MGPTGKGIKAVLITAVGPDDPAAATYDPATEQVTCASCRPDGLAPVSDVKGSQNGLFLTNDGRVFFSTLDPLVSRDTNEATGRRFRHCDR